jgi:CRP-like cAMP-binding protein
MTNPLIARLHRFTSLTEGELASLESACGSTARFGAGADVTIPGDRLGSYHILLEGWAARYKYLPDGRRQFPALLLPGDVCDLDGLMLESVHSGVCAITACTVAVLPHDRFRSLINQLPALRDAFWWLGSVENAVSAEWSVGLGRRSADERLGHLLCELFFRLWVVGMSTDSGYMLPLTQAELADVLGLSTVHVNRVFKTLRARGVVSFTDRWLTILDYKALKTMASFDPDYLHLEGLTFGSGPEQRNGADAASLIERSLSPP